MVHRGRAFDPAGSASEPAGRALEGRSRRGSRIKDIEKKIMTEHFPYVVCHRSLSGRCPKGSEKRKIQVSIRARVLLTITYKSFQV